VASIDRIKKVAEHAIKTAKDGNQVVVVVSAMAGETDRLIRLGNEAARGGNASNERELDALVATGEINSAALAAIAINSQGTSALSLNGAQAGIVTDSTFQRARIRFIETDRIKAELNEGKIVVIAGFQGVDDAGNLTTIGRGGSDTTAVAVAVALSADWCEIYSDVAGVFSADPNICPGAVRIGRSSYEELLETAGAGAKVVHMHAVSLAAKHGLPLALKKSPSVGETPSPAGTIVTREEINMAEVLVSTIAHTSNEAKISIEQMPDKAGLVARIFEPLARANINVDMIVQNVARDKTSCISFTIAKHDLKRAMQLTEVAAREIGAGKVMMAGDVAKLSIVGVGMRSHAGVAAKMFETLAREKIAIQMISTSEIKVSVVVDAKNAEKGIKALHEAFLG